MADSRSEYYTGKRIVVIGCAQGHGLAIAEGFSENGAEVLLIDRNPVVAEVATALSRKGRKAAYRIADVTHPEMIATALSEMAGDQGFDGLIYTPRGRVRNHWAKITSAEWDQDLDISLKSAFFSVQAAVPHLQARQGLPFVITLSSVLSSFVGAESAGYHAAKGGLESLTRYLAVQLGPTGIRVNGVQMGWIIKDQDLARFESDENADYRNKAIGVHPLRRVGRSSDLVDTVLFLGSENASFITGQMICLDGGLTLQDQATLACHRSIQKSGN